MSLLQRDLAMGAAGIKRWSQLAEATAKYRKEIERVPWKIAIADAFTKHMVHAWVVARGVQNILRRKTNKGKSVAVTRGA